MGVNLKLLIAQTSALLLAFAAALFLPAGRLTWRSGWIFLGMFGGFVLGGMVARRAVLEERALREGLPGYDAYLGRVRSRLIPGVW